LVDSVNGRDPSCPVETKIAKMTAIPGDFGPRGNSFVGFFSAGFLALRKVRFWATAGL